MVGIVDLKPHGDRPRLLIDVRIDERQPAVESSLGNARCRRDVKLFASSCVNFPPVAQRKKRQSSS